jgi:hypothetical protein
MDVVLSAAIKQTRVAFAAFTLCVTIAPVFTNCTATTHDNRISDKYVVALQMTRVVIYIYIYIYIDLGFNFLPVQDGLMFT